MSCKRPPPQTRWPFAFRGLMPRQRWMRASIATALLLVGLAGAAVWHQWERLRVAWAVECVVRGTAHGCRASGWAHAVTCGDDALHYLYEISEKRPALLGRHLFDRRP